MIYSTHIKQIIDRIFAFILAILLLPLISTISLILLITQGKTIFFFQERTGENKRKFSLIKFRTLKATDSSDLSMKNRRFTPLGIVLRKTGIDEIPQLVNIVKGEMSFVGPRPMPVEYEEKYKAEHLIARTHPYS